MQNTHSSSFKPGNNQQFNINNQQPLQLQKEIQNTKTAVGDNSDSEIPLFYYT
jgi:hypothetical protein